MTMYYRVVDGGYVVMDIGSCTCRADWGDHRERPYAVFPSRIGTSKYPNPGTTRCMTFRENYIGEIATESRGILAVRSPIERGMVTDWDGIQKIWHHVFYNWMRLCPDDHVMVQTEPALNSKVNREVMAQIMFEKLQTPGFYIAIEGALALYSTGRTSGVGIESGDGVTQIVPVHDGLAQTHAIQRLDFAGQDITLYLAGLLNKRGYSFYTSADLEIVREMKEMLCYTTLDVDKDLKISSKSHATDKSYQLPDGKVVAVGSEMFMCPEIMFKPSSVGLSIPGIHEIIHDSIMKCDEGMRNDLYGNIVIAGGNTLSAGMPERLTREMRSLAPDVTDINITAPADRMYSTWQGASMLSQLSTFEDMVITKQEYQEYGPTILHTKCL